MKSMKQFLEEKAKDFEERGTTYMVPMLQEMIEMEISTLDDLHEMRKVCVEERNRHQKFSVKFQYYWSIMTYLDDMIYWFNHDNTLNEGATHEH